MLRTADGVVLDLLVGRAAPKEVVGILAIMATPDASGIIEEIRQILPLPGPAGPAADRHQRRVAIVLAVHLELLQEFLGGGEVGSATNAVAIKVVLGILPVLDHSVVGDTVKEARVSSHSRELPPQWIVIWAPRPTPAIWSYWLPA